MRMMRMKKKEDEEENNRGKIEGRTTANHELVFKIRYLKYLKYLWCNLD